jgi:microsomal dipeptidase-like Zn-dependent dipeptidase
MVCDVHAHYPMHLVPPARAAQRRLLRAARRPDGLSDRMRAELVGLASLVANYRSVFSGPRVRIEYLHEGEVGVVLSVLYGFFDEIDVADGPRPHASYLANLERQIALVEASVAGRPRTVVAHGPAELAAARRDGALAVVHCVEGGFCLGPDPDSVMAAVGRLAVAGIAYITLAHLIWRGVATDAPALPFLSDEAYRALFPQPDEGLSDLGRAALRAMVEHRVIVDIAHMSERAVSDTFALLDELDPERSVPVIASHAGYRFGTQEYMLAPETLTAIKERDGVVGLIFASHQIEDGLTVRRGPLTALHPRRAFGQSIAVLRRHIDAIHDVVGSHRHTAIGSDFDGFIKPTLPGLQDERDMKPLEAALRASYGAADADLICHANGLRPLTDYWGGAKPGLSP